VLNLRNYWKSKPVIYTTKLYPLLLNSLNIQHTYMSSGIQLFIKDPFIKRILSFLSCLMSFIRSFSRLECFAGDN
jgi:hypothetical protein